MKALQSFCIILLGTIAQLVAQPAQRYAQQFNGDAVLLIQDSSKFDPGAGFSLEAWVKLSSSSPYAVIAGKSFNQRPSDPFQHFTLGMDGSGTKPEFVQTTGLSGSYKTVSSPIALVLNEWTHLTGVLENGQLKLYVNGVLKGQTSSPGLPKQGTGMSFGIGSGLSPARSLECCGWKGLIMQVAFWNTALSSSQVQTRLQGKPTSGEPGLAAFWDLNDSTGQVLIDRSGNNNNLIRGIKATTDANDPVAVKIASEPPYFELNQIQLPAQNFSPEDLIAMDFNNDNLPDLMATWLAYPPTYPATYQKIQPFINRGGMQFDYTSSILGSDSTVHPRDFTVADFNGDGKSDLFIADHGTDVNPFPGEQNKLYLQTNSGMLQEVGATSLPSVRDFSHHSAAGDIDQDGDMDIYVCNIYGQGSVGPYFLINNGKGEFTRANNRIPASLTNLNKKYISSRLVDMDKDGDCDLVLGGHDGTNNPYDLILANDGNGNFTEGKFSLPVRAGATSWGSVCQLVSDFTNDGFPDIIFSPMNYQTCSLQVLINKRNSSFGDSTKYFSQSWASSNTWIKWMESGDFNQDGWMDFVVATHGKVPKLYLNRGNARFEDVSAILPPVDHIVSTRVRDFNGDGKVDIAFLQSSGKIALLKNLRPYLVEIDSSNLISTALDNDLPHSNNKLSIYPNPAKDLVHIDAGAYQGTLKIDLVASDGCHVQSFQLDTRHENTIEWKGLGPGLYLLLCKDEYGNSITTKHVIIE